MIRFLAAIGMILCLGCAEKRHDPVHMDIQCECFSRAAYEILRLNTLAEPEPEPAKCCGTCGKNGLPKGKVLSGDKQKIVPCPCPDSCQCKCPSGTCKK